MAKKKAELTVAQIREMKLRYSLHRQNLLAIVEGAVSVMRKNVNTLDRWAGDAREAELCARNNCERIVQTNALLGSLDQAAKLAELNGQMGRPGTQYVDESMYRTNIDGSESD